MNLPSRPDPITQEYLDELYALAQPDRERERIREQAQRELADLYGRSMIQLSHDFRPVVHGTPGVIEPWP